MELLLAYDADSEFRTSLAQTALRVLAVRMNCFRPLKHCHPSSEFYRAKSFFVDRALELSTKCSKRQPQRGGSVYIDGFSQQYLLALKLFYARDFTNLSGLLTSLSANPLAAEKNNEDKLFLLRARMTRVAGKHEAARAAYGHLKYHPQFGAEATEFCDA